MESGEAGAVETPEMAGAVTGHLLHVWCAVVGVGTSDFIDVHRTLVRARVEGESRF